MLDRRHNKEQLLDDLESLMHDVGELSLRQDEQRPEAAALKTAQERLQYVLVSSPAIIYLLKLDDGQEVVASWVSDNVGALLGCRPPVEGYLQWWLENLHPDDRPGAETKIANLIKQDQLVSEYRFRHASGNYLWIRDEARLIRDAAGRPLECVGSWSDITERKQLEEQFRHAQKLEAVGRLAGGVAHDFNNLLTVIAGYTEIILSTLHEGDPLRDHVKQIHRAGERAAGLTRQLLAFSRKQILVPVALDLNSLLGDIEKMLGRLIGEDVELVVHLAPGLWAVRVDVGQFEQVVMNLAVNARDAMPQGGKLTIETANVVLDEAYVRLNPEARVGPHVLLAISDNGCGMDATTKARIFEPFFTTKGPEKGTGLGLATVFGIVKQSGGHLEVHSELGIGSTFKIYLPRHIEGAVAGKSVAGLKVAPRGTETVLLVEDEDEVRLLVRLVLERNGYKVLEARNPGQALLVCEQYEKTIHLLVTDVVMPDMNGRQLAERLLPMRAGMKVLYLSGYTDDAVVRNRVLDQDTPFLQKPFTTYALAIKVREVLDQ